MGNSKDKEEKNVSIRIELPDELRNRFKSVVVREGRTMTDLVVDFIQDYVEEKENELKQS